MWQGVRWEAESAHNTYGSEEEGVGGPPAQALGEREQIWDQHRYVAWLHTLHHPFIRVDAHGASMSHTTILLLLI